MEVLGITIDPNRDTLFDPSGIKRLKESYMKETETSPQELSLIHISEPTRRTPI